MRIGLDVMGGDFGPKVTVKGAILASKELPNTSKLILFGDKIEIQNVLQSENADFSKFEIVGTSQVVETGEHPVKAIAKKKDSSVLVGFMQLADSKIEGFASAGNTGAMLVGAMYSVKQVPGIIRPCITSPMPTVKGGTSILLDVGINPDCKPDVLYQYAILGSLYTKHVYNIENPRVALLNIGEEEEKGNLLTSATYKLMKDTEDFNFVGNIESDKIFDGGIADVIIADGFTGNIVLKEAEAFYALIKKRGINDEYFDKFNPEIYGGTPILGINSTVIIGHGSSSIEAIKNMVLHTHHVADVKLSDKIKKALNDG